MSNLLDKASIILTPTAYDNGKALCVKPSDGSGDFDFSRNSAATRVNAQGLVENVQILSSNLVQNGDFSEEGVQEVTNGSFTNGSTDWTLGTGWSIGENKAVHTGTQSLIGQSNILTIGKTYKITFDLSGADNSNYVRLLTSQYPNGGNYSSDGTITVYTSTNIDDLYIYGVGDVSISNISVKEVGQNWTLGSGWSIGNGVATCDGSANFSDLTQLNNNITIGKNYKITYTVSDYVSGSFKFIMNSNTTAGLERNADGTYTDYLTSAAPAYSFRTQGSGFTGSVTNISVIEITDDTNLPRINYEGFSYQDALGSEEVLNGGFDTNLNNWVAYSNTLISWESGGYALLDSNNNYWCKIKQSNVFEIGKTYKVILTAKSNRTDLNFHNSPITGSFSQADTFETFNQYYTATTTDFLFGYANAGSSTITIDNVSVKEITGQEVVPDSGCGSWLFEPQSTNLVTYSSDYSNASWSKSELSVSNGFISPDGTLNAKKITESTSNSKHQIFTTISSYTELTISFFAKKAERSFISVEKSSWGLTVFDLNNGSVVSGTGNVVDFGNGWYRCSATYTASPAQSQFYILLMKDENTVAYQGDGTSGLYLWGCQAEVGNISSYIPTSGSTVTRNQDVCTNGGSLATINSTEGTLYFEGAALSDDGTSRQISLSDNSYTNTLLLRYLDLTNTLQGVFRVGGAFKGNCNFTLSNPVDFIKVAYKYKNSDFALWVNGAEVATSTDGFSISAETLTELSFDRGDGTQNFFGKTKALAVWKEALSDSELQSLTTI